MGGQSGAQQGIDIGHQRLARYRGGDELLCVFPIFGLRLRRAQRLLQPDQATALQADFLAERPRPGSIDAKREQGIGTEPIAVGAATCAGRRAATSDHLAFGKQAGARHRAGGAAR